MQLSLCDCVWSAGERLTGACWSLYLTCSSVYVSLPISWDTPYNSGPVSAPSAPPADDDTNYIQPVQPSSIDSDVGTTEQSPEEHGYLQVISWTIVIVMYEKVARSYHRWTICLPSVTASWAGPGEEVVATAMKANAGVSD